MENEINKNKNVAVFMLTLSMYDRVAHANALMSFIFSL